jgi:hypothetical protein
VWIEKRTDNTYILLHHRSTKYIYLIVTELRDKTCILSWYQPRVCLLAVQIVVVRLPFLTHCFPLLCSLSSHILKRIHLQHPWTFFLINSYIQHPSELLAMADRTPDTPAQCTPIRPANRVSHHPNYHRRAPSWCRIWVARSSWERVQAHEIVFRIIYVAGEVSVVHVSHGWCRRWSE